MPAAAGSARPHRESLRDAGAAPEGCPLPLTHITEPLAWAVDAVLLAAALAALLRWRNRLAWVVLLIAADPLWTPLVERALIRIPPGAPLIPLVAEAPLWAAFIIGFAGVFSAAGGTGGEPS